MTWSYNSNINKMSEVILLTSNIGNFDDGGVKSGRTRQNPAPETEWKLQEILQETCTGAWCHNPYYQAKS